MFARAEVHQQQVAVWLQADWVAEWALWEAALNLGACGSGIYDLGPRQCIGADISRQGQRTVQAGL